MGEGVWDPLWGGVRGSFSRKIQKKIEAPQLGKRGVGGGPGTTLPHLPRPKMPIHEIPGCGGPPCPPPPPLPKGEKSEWVRPPPSVLLGFGHLPIQPLRWESAAPSGGHGGQWFSDGNRTGAGVPLVAMVARNLCAAHTLRFLDGGA